MKLGVRATSLNEAMRGRCRRKRAALFVAGLCAFGALATCTQGEETVVQTSVLTPSSTTFAPSSTVTVESSAPASTVESVVTTTTVPPLVGALSGWPPAPSKSPALPDVPYMLPTIDIDAGVVELSTVDQPEAGPDSLAFVQEYVVGESGVFVSIETLVGRQPDVPSNGQPLAAGVWTSAHLVETELRSNVVLSDASGGVTISAVGAGELSRVATLIASSLVRRSAVDVGWVVQPIDVSPVTDPDLMESAVLLSEGWTSGLKERTTRWIGADGGPVVDLIVSTGRPHLARAQPASNPSLVDVVLGNGAIGQAIPGKGSLVAWSLIRDVTVTVVTRGPVADTLRVAESITVATEQDWLALGVLLPPETEVGCDYFFFDC